MARTPGPKRSHARPERRVSQQAPLQHHFVHDAGQHSAATARLRAMRPFEPPRRAVMDNREPLQLLHHQAPQSTVETARELPTVAHKASPAPCATPTHSEEIGRLVTVIGPETHIIRVKAREKELIIGRHRTASFILDRPTVSNIHGKIYTFAADTGDVLVCYEDVSRSGTVFQGRVLLHNVAVVLSEGDTLSIDGQTFYYLHGPQGASVTRNASVGHIENELYERDFPKVVGPYLISRRTLGSGSFAVVHLAEERRTRRQLACKVLHKKLIIAQNAQDKIELEVGLLMQLRHANIAALVDAQDDASSWYLLLDLCTGGDLHTYLTRKERLSGDVSLFLTYQLLLGLAYLHNVFGVAHRDIKPENVLLRNRGHYPHLMITDFGTAHMLCHPHRSDYVGTIDYWAPECFTEALYDPRGMDCFGLGCIVYMMMAGYHPFMSNLSDDHPAQASNPDLPSASYPQSSEDMRSGARILPSIMKLMCTRDKAVAKVILAGNVHIGGEFAGTDAAAIDMIQSLLASSPFNRLHTTGALKHRWIGSNLTELKNLYKKNCWRGQLV